MLKRLMGSKTFYLCLAGILTAIGTADAGEIGWGEAAKLIAEAVAVIFVRDGIAKGK